MALTVTADSPIPVSNKKHVQATVTFDSSYPTGGESLVASDFGLSTLEEVIPHGATGGTVVKWEDDLLLAYYQDGTTELVEVSNTDDLSAESVRVTAIGW